MVHGMKRMSKPLFFPTKLKILSQEWEIIYVSDIENKLLDRRLLYGKIDTKTNKIWILDSLSDIEKMKTLFHELLHLLCEAGQIYEILKMSDKDIEIHHNILSSLLVHLFADNHFFKNVKMYK